MDKSTSEPVKSQFCGGSNIGPEDKEILYDESDKKFRTVPTAMDNGKFMILYPATMDDETYNLRQF